MHGALLEAGVDQEQIVTFERELDGINHALDVASEGDLVLLLLGYASMPIIAEHLKTYYAPGNGTTIR